MSSITPSERSLFEDMPLRQDSRRIIQNVTDLLAERVKNVHPDMEMSVNSTYSNTDSVMTAYVAIDCVADDIRRSAQLFMSSIPSRDTFLCNLNEAADALLHPKSVRPSKRQYALPFLPEGMNLEVAKLVDDFLKEPRADIANQIAALGIGMKLHILPRGTPVEAAENRLPKLESLEPIIGLLRISRDEEETSAILRLLCEWGDGTAVPVIVGLMRTSHSEQMILSCIHALHNIGGPDAIVALKDFAENGASLRIKKSADWSLSELESGGTCAYDGIDGTINDLPSDELERHRAGMRRIPLDTPIV